MHGNLPIAIAQPATGRRSSVITPGTALRQFFRPCVLSVLALAVTVGGWGYGYKLSQYLHRSHLSTPSATRMWVEHRDDSFEAPDHHQHQLHKLLVSQFFRLSASQLPNFSHEPVFTHPLQSRVLTFVSPLHPLRAPPTFLS